VPSLDDVFLRSPRVVGRQIADEFLLVPLAGRGADLDSIYNLSRVGTFIWQSLDGKTDGRGIVSSLTERFDVDGERAAADYLEFVATLLTIGAIEARSGAAP
jgi:hypothetical protein